MERERAKDKGVFVEKTGGCTKLIFDSRCIHNLAIYITKHEVKEKGNMAIAATVPVMRSIIQLASEFQVNDKNLLVLGITPESKLIEFQVWLRWKNLWISIRLKLMQRNREMLDKLEKDDPGGTLEILDK